MALVWAAYTHVVHYLVDTEEETIDQVELPGWINTFGEPEIMWFDNGVGEISPDSPVAEEVVSILENEPMPEVLS